MDHVLQEIFADAAIVQVAAMLAGALFFLLAGIMEVRDEHPEGFLYLSLALFFAVGHAACLLNLPAHLGNSSKTPMDFGIWSWLALLLAPALIVLYVVRSILDFVLSRAHRGLVKLFFGLTLLCYLFMLGAHWPVDVKGVLTLVWLTLFFKVELDVAAA